MLPVQSIREAAMSTTARRVRRSCSAAVVGGAVVLLPGCGGGDPTADSAATAPAAQPATTGAPGPSGAADFCTRAAGIDDRVDAALADADHDVPSVPDAFAQIAAELRGIQAPAEISTDWAALAGGVDRMGQAFADLDLTDPSSLGALDAAEGELSSASHRVEDYLRDVCGITP
jgi:hypothetical protein